jgi:two-component system nitrate/nitrite response regulator NarL
MDRLTQRERKVAILTAQGFSNKGVARRLGITDGTVKVHLHAIYQKIGVSNRTELSLLLLPRGVPTALLEHAD